MLCLVRLPPLSCTTFFMWLCKQKAEACFTPHCLMHLQPEDRFGSPSTADLDSFVREFAAAFEEALGEALAGDIAVEVSSPVRLG